MTDHPIACTLPHSEVADRLALIEALAAGGMQLRFPAAAEPRVRELVALESQCCAFLRFAVSRTDDAIVVDIAAPTAG
jgi:hypothetical protein